MAETGTSTQSPPLEGVEAVENVTIGVRLDYLGENIILTNETQNKKTQDDLEFPLGGNAVIISNDQTQGNVTWMKHDERIKRIMIRPKILSDDIWNLESNETVADNDENNIYDWTTGLNLVAKTWKSDIEYRLWSYSLTCELHSEFGPTLSIDPIIRVNK
jgi:hypothetical protein